MYEAMIRRVAQRCLEDLVSDDPMGIAYGFAHAIEILTTVAREMEKPKNWLVDTCIYQLYHDKLCPQFKEISVERMINLREIAEGRRNLP